ncbi:hypothetical protein BJV82DRAFT_635324 [Fennellomyces sp. T-0311]|nr:hypothetical protein BJV82DRAFT_635324 [Fennellomyces sp. T-0311]
MVKDNVHPKAVNIIRPTRSLSVKQTPQPTQSLTLPGSKPRVARSAKVNLDERPYGGKPQLNIYHPPPKPSQSQRPPTLFSQRQRPRPVATMTTTTATTASRNNKPSFEIYKPAKKQTLSRSLTTPVLPSASTPASIPSHHQRQHPSVPPVQTSMARSVTNHSITTVPLYVDSSDDDSDRSDTYSETYSHKRRSLSGSDTDTLATDTPIESRNEKAVDETEEDEGGDEDSVINEARVNRKIADLEISNLSLLAVNEMLEITVKRQASQVAKLKQQLEQDGVMDIKPVVSPIRQAENRMMNGRVMTCSYGYAT